MSSFGIGTNVKDIDSGQLKGKRYDIACKTWFTANCIPRPLSFKFEGDDGLIQTVAQISIKSTEDKNYDGIKSKEYSCYAVIGGIRHEFKLIFYMEACKWIMVI